MAVAVEILLLDSSPKGMMVASTSSWIGVAISCPRTTISDLKTRKEVHRPGIYFLWGPDPDIEGEIRTYVGEGVPTWERISSHSKKKEFWNKVISVNSLGHNLTKTHIQYLEAKAYSEIKRIGLATLKQNVPKMPEIKESEMIYCETFYEGMLKLLPILGFPYLNPVIPDEESFQSEHPGHTFVVKGKGVEARAIQTDSGLLVMAGSSASKDDTPSWTSGKDLRNQLIEEGALIDVGEHLQFTRNVPFKSPSAASNVILAKQSAGPVMWKEADTGITWKEFFSKDTE